MNTKLKRIIALAVLCILVFTGCGKHKISAWNETIEKSAGETAGVHSNAQEKLSIEGSLETEMPRVTVCETEEEAERRTEVPSKKTNAQETAQELEESDVTGQKLTLAVGGQEFTATIEDNETTKAFLSMLPLTLNMSEVNGNEKVSTLSESIRKEDSRCPETIYSGDIMCYGSDQLVIFYDTFSTPYSYVKIGHVEDSEGYVKALGFGSVEVTFSLK